MFNTAMQAISTILAAIIGALFTMRVFRGSERSDTAREQLDTVYAKAFRLVESVLYKTIPRSDCDRIVLELEEISLGGGVLTDPELFSLIARYKKSPDGQLKDYPKFKYSYFTYQDFYLYHWFCLCNHIDRLYDVLCKRSFLPVRSVKYRLEHKQYINQFTAFVNLLRFDWPGALFVLSLIALLVLLIASYG